MKPERALVAERAIARHDAALLRPGPNVADLVPALARMSERMARILRDALVPLLGGAEPQVAPRISRNDLSLTSGNAVDR